MSTFAQLPSGVEVYWDRPGDNWERLTPFGWEAQVTFWMPWATKDAFATVVGGLPQQFKIGTVTYTRVVPLQYPNLLNCYADSVELWGDGEISLPSVGYGIDYSQCFARVHFGPVPWLQTGNSPMFTWQEETSAEMVSRPGTAYKFPSDSLILNQRVGVRVPVKDIILTAHNVVAFDPTNSPYDAYVGMVSNATMLGKAAGTLQYAGLSTAGQTTIGNVTSWTLTHKLRWRAINHNQIMRPDGTGGTSNGFEAPVDVGTGTQYLLPVGDISGILQ